LRWLPYLRPTGVAMVNTLRLPPPVVSAGLYDYPLDPIGELAASGIAVHAFDAGAIAEELGNAKLVNTIMLGAISDHLPFPAEMLQKCIVEGFRAYKPKLADINAQALSTPDVQAGHVITQLKIPTTDAACSFHARFLANRNGAINASRIKIYQNLTGGK
jgi:indolepyruvate ferredoxin oxidoreductase beta subunit